MSDDAILQVPLETLLELPLPAEALATVCREVMSWTVDAPLRRRLALELAVLELDRCRQLGESDGWRRVIPRLESWETTWHNLCSVATEAELEHCRPRWQGAMSQLQTALEGDLMEHLEAAPAIDRDTPQLREWAELLWWCWERRDPAGGDPLLRERMCRLGALAWLALADFRHGTPGGLEASGRAQRLLVELAGLTPPDVLWVRNGLQQGLAAHLAGGLPADGDWEPWLAWAALIVARSPEGDERARREAQLWTARAALEIAETLGL
jgi:hypothetical protein